MNNVHAILTMKDTSVHIGIGKEDVLGRIVSTVSAIEPLPINGDPKLRAQAIGTLVLLAIKRGATSIEIIEG